MTSEDELAVVASLSALILEIMTLAKPPQLPAELASVASLQTLHGQLLSLREFLYAASAGDLSRSVDFKGFIGGALKTLQANLKHMTWQTKMVASGDFSQRVEFMGEFAQSFNAMVLQLDQTLRALESKDAALSRANGELLKEITIRKQTEAALRESEEAFRLLAITDALTGLYNRRHFNQLALAEISRVIRHARPLAVLMLDIDFFKRVNDTYGHTSGDTVLKMVAGIAKATFRASDILARYGGEEFIVMLPETSLAGAVAVAERLRRQIAETPAQTERGEVVVTVSLGVSDSLGETQGKANESILAEFIDRADQALYAAKKGGRNRVTVYEPGE